MTPEKPLTDAEVIAVELEMRQAQELREKKAAAELATRRAIFEDALAGIGIHKGPRGRPGVLEAALRLYVKHCERHMGRLMGGDALARQLYGTAVPERDVTFTPQMALRARQAALDALFLLNAGELQRHVDADLQEATTHHKLVKAHEKRCTHTDLVTGESTWRAWTFAPAVETAPPLHAQRCISCGATRPDSPAEGWRRFNAAGSTIADLARAMPGGAQLIDDALRDRFHLPIPTPAQLLDGTWPVRPPCSHRYVAFNVTFDEASGPAGRTSVRCADCGDVQPLDTMDLAAGEDTAAMVSMNNRGEVIDVVRIENLGPEPSIPDPAATPDTGKAPPAD
ncbi:MAG: hypothetical protein Q8L48_16800 [Archangium sp.]|nr:hypothetical protein [Archangium sp.]